MEVRSGDEDNAIQSLSWVIDFEHAHIGLHILKLYEIIHVLVSKIKPGWFVGWKFFYKWK